MTDQTLQTITLEEAQQLIMNKQEEIAQEAEKVTNDLIINQQNESKNIITNDEQDQADNLLDTI